MEIYLVGGAVRDELLGRAVSERDWVVVGSSPEALTALGYRQVGRDFPVFLHPATQDEYALARTERKSGPGHTGFVCHAGPDVTLEQDLVRRDLTINAMARDESGRLVDLFGGADDLGRRLLRHVSDAFVEDPLRLFRVARFAAQLPGFEVAPETLALLRHMAAENQLAELSAERVWVELEKALQTEAPARFFEVLQAANALAPWLVEFIDRAPCFPYRDRPDAVQLTAAEMGFAALCWNLDPETVDALCERLRAPRRYQRLAESVARHGRCLAHWRTSAPAAVLDGLAAIGAFVRDRDPEPALRVIEACSGAALDDLRRAMAAAAAIGAAAFVRQGLTGPAIGDAIRTARETLISEMGSGSF
jgi:tRNA nucleotidyltransferase (CCA-adding enzyme)